MPPVTLFPSQLSYSDHSHRISLDILIWAVGLVNIPCAGKQKGRLYVKITEQVDSYLVVIDGICG